MTSTFDATDPEGPCIVIGVGFGLLWFISSIQFLRHVVAYSPWMMQKWIHLILILVTGLRGYFLMSIGRGGASGSTQRPTVLMEILEQFPSLLFFTLCSFLIYFWARVYYHAVGRTGQATQKVRPVLVMANVFMCVCQIVAWIAVSPQQRMEMTLYVGCTVTGCMLMLVGMLVYGQLAYEEVGLIPVHVGTRSQKLREISILTWTWTLCFTCRSIVLVWIMMVSSPSLDQLLVPNLIISVDPNHALVLLVLYYVAFEMTPCSMLLYYFRRLPASSTSDHHHELQVRMLQQQQSMQINNSNSQNTQGTLYEQLLPNNEVSL